MEGVHNYANFINPTSGPIPLASDRILTLNMRGRDIRINCGRNSGIGVVDNPLRKCANAIGAISARGGGIYIVLSVFNERAPIRLRLSRVSVSGSWDWCTRVLVGPERGGISQ